MSNGRNIYERLDNIQAELEKRGFKDIKLCTDPINIKKATWEEVAVELAELLEAVLEGNYQEARPFND